MKEDALPLHEKLRQAVMNSGGEELPTSEIIRLVLAKFPRTKVGSIHPNDHSNKGPEVKQCWCAGREHRIFEQTRRGWYKVRLDVKPRFGTWLTTR